MLIDTSVLPAFTAAALVIALTPGADTFIVLRSAIARGFRYGMLAQAGVLTGIAVQTLVMVTGLGLLLTQIPGFLAALKYLGSAYLIYLGVMSLRLGLKALRSRRGVAVERGGRDLGATRRSFYFAGVLTNLTNPKVLLFYLAFFPQFLGTAENTALQLLVLAAIFALLGVVILTACSALAAKVSSSLSSPTVTAVLDLVCGVVFIGLATVVLFSAV
ncbi:LysE family translocator [Micrococcales bacterium 31B]|nr:LysE family translocator [Micrococcales bacterium 31B]